MEDLVNPTSSFEHRAGRASGLKAAAQGDGAGSTRYRPEADPDRRRAVALLLVVGMVMEMRDEDADPRARERAHDDVGRKVLAGANALVADERRQHRAD